VRRVLALTMMAISLCGAIAARADAPPPELPLEVGACAPDSAAGVRWERGVLRFECARLEAVLAEYNRRHRSLRLVIVDPALGNVRIGGALRAVSPKVFAASLQAILGLYAGGRQNFATNPIVYTAPRASPNGLK